MIDGGFQSIGYPQIIQPLGIPHGDSEIPLLIKADIHVECTYVAFEPLVTAMWRFFGNMGKSQNGTSNHINH
jgi:hypothetical protein